MELSKLLEEWEARSRGAHPSDAMLINRHIRELREAALAARPAAVGAEEVAIVCDWSDADPFPRFIEAEINGKSVSLEWRDREDGKKELVVPVALAARPAAVGGDFVVNGIELSEAIRLGKRYAAGIDKRGMPRAAQVFEALIDVASKSIASQPQQLAVTDEAVAVVAKTLYPNSHETPAARQLAAYALTAALPHLARKEN